MDAQRSWHRGTAASAAALPAVLAWLPRRLFFKFPFKDICPLIFPRGQQQPAYHLFDWHTIFLGCREPRPSSQLMLSPKLSCFAEASRATIRSGAGHHLLLSPWAATVKSSSLGTPPWAPSSCAPRPQFFYKRFVCLHFFEQQVSCYCAFCFFSTPGEIYCCKAP